jgi:sporulation integral membrane protein YtvI
MGLGVVLLYGVFTIGFPFLLALLIAIFLERVILLLINTFKMSRITAATFVCTFFTTVALGLMYILGFKIVSESIAFWKKAPNYLNEAYTYMDDATMRTELLYRTVSPEMAEQLQGWMETGIKALTDNIQTIIAAVSGFFLNVAKAIPSLFVFLIVFVIALYLMSYSLPRLYEAFLSLFEKGSRSKVASVMNDLRKALLGFLFAQTIISVLTYIVALIGLLILRVDYPMAIALLVILVDILPVLGTGSVFVPWALYSLLVGNTSLGIGLLVLFVVIMIFRRLIEPKIIGDAVGINALAALISMYVGFKVVGVIGLILGPVIIIIYQALRRVGLLQFNIKL